MKKYLLIALLLIPSITGATVINEQSIDTERSENTEPSSNDMSYWLGGIVTATTTIHEIKIKVRINSSTTTISSIQNSRLEVTLNCTISATTTSGSSGVGDPNRCTTGQGYPADNSSNDFYPSGNSTGSTVFTNDEDKYVTLALDTSLTGGVNGLTLVPGVYYWLEPDWNLPASVTYEMYFYGSEIQSATQCLAESDQNPCQADTTNNSNDEDNIYRLYYQLIQNPLLISTNSRIVDFTPKNNDIVNPSIHEEDPSYVDWELEYFFNSADYGTVDKVRISWYNLERQITYIPDFDVINLSGTKVVTGSKLLDPGVTTAVISFIDSETGILYGDTVAYDFVVGWSDLYLGAGQGTTTLSNHPILNALQNGSSTVPGLTEIFASTTASSSIDCKIYEWWSSPFQRLGCSLSETILGGIKDIFIPTDQDWTSMQQQLKSGIAYRFPLGYVTRTVDIMDTEATSSLPVLSITLKDEGPLGGGDYGFDLNGIFTQANTYIRDDFTTGNGLVETEDATTNIWDIFMTLFNYLVYISLFLIIVGDIMGISFTPSMGEGPKTRIYGIRDDGEISYESPAFSRYKNK